MVNRRKKSFKEKKSGVMETDEGSPQGGNIYPILVNIYLNNSTRSIRNVELPLWLCR